MKKFFILCLMAFAVCVNVNAQNNESELKKTIQEQIKCDYSIDNIAKEVRAHYNIVYDTNLDSQTMYKNLMTILYLQDDIKINKTDNLYQIRVENEDTWYDIYLKDYRMKITAFSHSESVYESFSYSEDYGKKRLEYPKVYISAWIVRTICGYLPLFDF